MNNRQRPTISNPQVGTARHRMYKDAIARYQDAMKNGFYIEAISLMESLISDRIESLLNAIAKTNNTKENYSYRPLGNLVRAALNNKGIVLPKAIIDILNEIKEWAKKRNAAIHEMAKLSDTNISISFSSKYEDLRSVAEEAYKLFREFDKALASYRKSIGSQDGKILL